MVTFGILTIASDSSSSSWWVLRSSLFVQASAIPRFDMSYITVSLFTSDPVSGGRLLDFGSGPAIYHVISASRCYSSITCSDYTPDAYAHIQKWRSRDADAFDWTYMFKHIAALEGDGYYCSIWHFLSIAHHQPNLIRFFGFAFSKVPSTTSHFGYVHLVHCTLFGESS